MIERIKIVRATNVVGVDVSPGQILDVPEECSIEDAQLLIGLKKASVNLGKKGKVKKK